MVKGKPQGKPQKKSDSRAVHPAMKLRDPNKNYFLGVSGKKVFYSLDGGRTFHPERRAVKPEYLDILKKNKQLGLTGDENALFVGRGAAFRRKQKDSGSKGKK